MTKEVNKLKDSFKDKSLFDQALTHRSYVNENPDSRGNNERLEFLGDAILEFVVSDFIFRKLPKKEEGFLTALRSNLVNTKNLAVLAKKLELGEILLLSKGEEQGGGRDNESLLADTVEAVIGAIFIDQGFEASKKFIDDQLLDNFEEKLNEPLKDAKSRLQEAVQQNGYMAPRYKVVKETGPDHNKTFEVEVHVDGKKVAKGEGKSKSIAEQDAAESALAKFEVK